MKRYISILSLAAVVAVIQLGSTLCGREYYLTQLTMAAYYSLVAVGLCMLMGYAGQISLGHAAFFAIGGYTTAVLTTMNLQAHTSSRIVSLLVQCGLAKPGTDLYGVAQLSLSPWIALGGAGIITVVIAIIIGIPVLKLKGHYLAMATLGFGIIVYRITLGTGLFGQADGISGVPQFTIVPGIAIGGGFANKVINYYIAWVMVICGMLLLLNLIDSRVGRALKSIHGSEEAASAIGIHIPRYKLMVFIISALFASLAGVCLTHYNGGIGPSEAGVMKSVRYVAIVAVGGMANLWGTLIMSVLLNYLSLRGYFGSYDDAVFGAILIGIMLFAPDGIIKTIRTKVEARVKVKVRE
ncbi:MAG: branched-chain amino acid ABC transporter permease [Candidatus Raymondbacteria bacterium RifOxyA12_full_50_37]|uniref:Branched-chain amino acid ABC transporter permease n=1 Tax=Candidatus Raymondbacteria bacterium RIFOXYD12_FULL_49_13 TaxID=1817890 RepID=A0A1F7F5D8_UNCRA|nr:MAG: branched-chain amino acid ABC transporter permease [Candidatus Raymondbacteria bacterium RIFOXYA2_FULL_49_16]OGJ90138.1 MAG: branched-chain amino acid ABC transporter permease [Candidatus Raymondbacteria bacterium RifOxyA12_full_50_37]OGJ92140.1 MAG: branched-chain amino acid ABC transporter permease [Candidatus Raymondbacteria bacterium RifOxyB12_full_50_8]OGJ97723.1 MAG: branched-chain amino acid ABC transporter permease [Candidatus Raymondbacteria bacterium RIFOXYC2_FULL_50_21]OGK017